MLSYFVLCFFAKKCHFQQLWEGHWLPVYSGDESCINRAGGGSLRDNSKLAVNWLGQKLPKLSTAPKKQNRKGMTLDCLYLHFIAAVDVFYNCLCLPLPC